MIAWECVCMLVVSSSGAKAFSPPAAYSEPGWCAGRNWPMRTFYRSGTFFQSYIFVAFLPCITQLGQSSNFVIDYMLETFSCTCSLTAPVTRSRQIQSGQLTKLVLSLKVSIMKYLVAI